MSKKFVRRREANDGHYFQMFEWLMKTTAWRYASVYERSLYLELKRRYNGRNNGAIQLSHREGMELLGCSNSAIEAAFRGLKNKGFISVTEKGSFQWKANADGSRQPRSTRWRLTELPQDLPERVLSGGTKDFVKWRPGNDEEKNTARSERANGPPTTDHSEKMARSQRAMHQLATAQGGQ